MSAFCEEKREKKSSGMETLDRIERKLRKVWDWCEMLCQETKENHKNYLFQDDEESNKYIAMYLDSDEEAALGRVKFVKNFIM